MPLQSKGLAAMTSHSSENASFMLDEDTLHEECGVFGILGHEDAAALTALGLHALQHRGQEAAGIAATKMTQVPSRILRYII